MSAANKSIYSTHSTKRTTHFRDLPSTSISLLCHILHAPPHPLTTRHHEKYVRKTEYLISDLPPGLRSTLRISRQTPNEYLDNVLDDKRRLLDHYLCVMHKGIERKLIHSIWRFVKHALTHSVGKYVYPVIMLNNPESSSPQNYLTQDQEIALRALEPLLRMFVPSYDAALSTPRGKSPVVVGEKWAFQQDGCAACMLARIGGDAGVLGALITGLVACFGTKGAGRKPVEGVKKSARLKFMVEWFKAERNLLGDVFGGPKVDKMWDLGRAVRRARKEMKKVGVLDEKTCSTLESAYLTSPPPPPLSILLPRRRDDDQDARSAFRLSINGDYQSIMDQNPFIDPQNPFEDSFPYRIRTSSIHHISYHQPTYQPHHHAEPQIATIETLNCLPSRSSSITPSFESYIRNNPQTIYIYKPHDPQESDGSSKESTKMSPLISAGGEEGADVVLLPRMGEGSLSRGFEGGDWDDRDFKADEFDWDGEFVESEDEGKGV